MSENSLYYHLSYSKRVIESLQAIAKRSVGVWKQEEVRLAIERMHAWLRADPETLGEPFRDHVHMRQTEYLGFSGPLVVRYNVHLSSQTVFVLAPIRFARWAGF